MFIQFLSGKTMEEMKPSTVMGLLAIFREAFKIPFRNAKLAVSLALILITPYSLLLLVNEFAIKPFIFYFTMKSFLIHNKEPQNHEYQKLQYGVKSDIRIVIGDEAVLMVLHKVILLCSIIATVYASTAIHACKKVTLKELIPVIGGTWKRTLITWLYITFFKILYVPFLAVLKVFGLVIEHGVGSIALDLVLALFAFAFALFVLIFSTYLAAVWMLGLVISVVEEDCCGIGALLKAKRLIQRRRFQAFLLSLIIEAVSLVISHILSIKRGDATHSRVRQFVRSVVLISITSLVSLFSYVVYTVLYCDCKKSHGEEVEVTGDMGYSLVPATVSSDKDIP